MNAGSIGNAKRWEERKELVRSAARAEWPMIRNNPRMMGFLGLYWGEGTKRSEIAVANGDPGIIKASYLVLRQLGPLSKIVAEVRCYPEHDLQQCASYWKNVLIDAIIRPKVKKWVGSKRQKFIPYGMCYLRFNDWQLRLKILTWIDCWRAELGINGLKDLARN